MVGGYHVYNTDIWASVVGEEFLKMTNSCLVGGIHTRCSVNLAYFICRISHRLVIVAG